MDPGKRRALIEWVNAIDEEANLTSLHELKDGKQLVNLIKLSDQTLTQLVMDGDRLWMKCVEEYIENFFHLNFCENKLIDFELIYNAKEKDVDLEFELAKVLLAVLSTSVQEKNRHLFICPAMNLDVTVQIGVKELLESVVCPNDPQSILPPDFADILTRSTVSDIKQASPLSRVSNAKDNISSPLRMLTLTSSPTTPLAEFMQSPQLAQKILLREKENKDKVEALIRQKEQDIKKLELVIGTERHLRQELELDLQDKSTIIDNKDFKIRDLLKQLQHLRKMQDETDELVSLRAENEKYENEISRIKNKLEEMMTIKKQSEFIESENKNLLDEIDKYREEMKMIDSLKMGYENYRTQCHKLQLSNSTIESTLSQKEAEFDKLNDEKEALLKVLEQLKEINAKQKHEIEEETGGLCNGESMVIITDKKLSEVEAELEKIQQTWIHPDTHNDLQSKHDKTLHERDEFETSFHQLNETNDQLEEEICQLKYALSKHESDILKLTQSNQEYTVAIANMEERYNTDTLSLKNEITDICVSRDETINKLETDYKSKFTHLDLCLQKEIDNYHSLKQIYEELSEQNNKHLVTIETNQWEISEFTRLQTESTDTINQLQEKEYQQTKLVSEMEKQLAKSVENYDQFQQTTTMKIQELEAQHKKQKYDSLMLEQTTSDTVQSLKISKQELQEKLSHVHNSTSEIIKRLETECQCRKEEFQQLERASSCKIQDLQLECRTWCESNEQLDQSLTQTKAELTRQIENKKHSDKSTSDQISHLNSSLSSKCDQITHLNTLLEKEMEDQQYLEESTSCRISLLESTIDTQKQQYAGQELSSRNKMLELETECSRLVACKSSLEIENENLSQELVRLQASSSVKIQELETECENQKQQFNHLECSVNAERQRLQTCVVELEDILHEKETELETNKRDYSNMEENMSVQIENLKSQCETQKLLQSELESKISENKLHFESLSVNQKEEIVDLEQTTSIKIQKLETTCQKLSHVNSQLEAECAKLTEIHGDLDQKTANKIQHLQTEKEVIQQELESQKQTSLHNMQEMESQLEELSKIKSKLEIDSENQKQESQQNTETMHNKIQKSETECRELSEAKNELETKYENQKQRYLLKAETMSNTIQELQTECRELSEAKNELETKYENQKQDYLLKAETMSNTIQELQTECRELSEAKNELETKYENQKQGYLLKTETMSNTIQELQTECRELSEVRDEYKDQKQELVNMSEITSDRIKQLKEQLQELVEEKLSTSTRIHDIESVSEKHHQQQIQLETDCESQKQQLRHLMDLEEMTSAKMQELETEFESEKLKSCDEKLTMTDTIRELETECDKLSEVQSELEKIKQTWIQPALYKQLQIQNDETVHELTSLQQTAAAKISKLEVECQKLSDSYTELETECETHKCANQKSCDKIKSLETCLLSKDELMSHRQTQIQNQTDTIEHLEQTWSTKFTQLESQNENLKDTTHMKVTEMKTENERLLKAYQTLEESMTTKSEQFQFEFQELKKAKGFMEENSNGKIKDLEAEIERLCEAKDYNVRKSGETIEELKKKLEHLVKSKQELEMQHHKVVEDTEQYWKLQLITLEDEFEKGIQEQKETYERELKDEHDKYEVEMSNLSCQQEGVILSQRAILEDRIEDIEAKMDRQKSEWMKKLNQNKSDNGVLVSNMEEHYKTETSSLKNKMEEICESHDETVSRMEADYQSKLSHLESCLCEQIEMHKSLKSELAEYKSKSSFSQSQYNNNLLKKQAELQSIEDDYQSKIGHLQTCLEEQLTVQKQMKAEIINNNGRVKADCEQKLRNAALSHSESLNQLEEDHKAQLTHLEACLKVEMSTHQEVKTEIDVYSKKLAEMETTVLERSSDFEKHIIQLKKEKEQTIENMRISHEQQISKQNEEIGVLQNQINQLSTLAIEKSNMAVELSRLQGQITPIQEECFRLNEDKKTLENKLSHSKEEFRNIIKQKDVEFFEKTLSERQAYEEQLYKRQQEIHCLRTEYNTNKEMYQQSMKSQVNIFQAENTSLKQQLSAIEEEKQMMEDSHQRLAKAHEDELKQLTNENEAEVCTLKVEKDSLTAQLEIFHHRQELTQSTVSDLGQQIHNYESQRVQFESRCRDMEQRLQILTKHEHKLKIDLEKSVKTNSQLENNVKETSKKLQDYVEREFKLIKNHEKEMNQAQELNNNLRKQVDNMKQEVASIDRSSRAMLKKSQTELEDHYSQHQESLTTLSNALEIQRQMAEKYRLRAEKADNDLTKLAEEASKFKTLNQNVRSLEAQLEHSNRQVRDYKHQLDAAGTALLGDNSVFIQEIQGHSSDASLNDSLENINDVTAYNLQSHDTSVTSYNSKSSLFLPDNKENRQFSLLSFASSTSTLDSRKSSTSSLTSQMTLRSRSSDSRGSRQSVLSVPHGTGNLFSCADEPFDDYEWNRLSELQRRNTLCLPHMKSSYPIETQTVELEAIDDDSLRESQTSDTGSMIGRKRKTEKSGMETALVDIGNKQARHGSTIYQKPGPPTPGTRTNSKSPQHKSKSPHTPRGRVRKADKTPSKKTPKEKKKNPRDSIAFSIGFSPKTRLPKRLTRQTGFINNKSEKPEGKQSPVKQVKKRKPLGIMNFFQ